MRHLVLSSNRWFSAVSDYCLQLMIFLHERRGEAVTFGGQSGSPLETRCERLGIPVMAMPLWPPRLSNQVRILQALTHFLRNIPPAEDLCVWTFEGREHTLCALHRTLFPKLWRTHRLVRVRGQAAPAARGLVSRWLYERAVHKVVFAAQVVHNRTPFSFVPARARVQHYCTDSFNRALPPERRAGSYAFAPGLPSIDFEAPVLLVLGRYDPVKGHEWLLEAFARMERSAFAAKLPIQLVFIGKSENLQASYLHMCAQKLLGQGESVGSRHFATDSSGQKRVFVFDERLADAPLFVRQAHIGIIPSLDSEVICRVAVEFLQAGTPLIATQIGALPEVLESKSGTRLVSARDVEGLAAALRDSIDMLENRPEEYAALRKSAHNFGWERFALDQLADSVEWVLAAPQAATPRAN